VVHEFSSQFNQRDYILISTIVMWIQKKITTNLKVCAENVERLWSSSNVTSCGLTHMGAIQEETAVLREIIVCVILSKKVHMDMGPILNGYRDYGKKKLRTVLQA
jgi:hypothetical protein